MKRILVWDLPVRLFHWLLSAAFLGAFVIANLIEDESSLFALHMWLGGIAAFMVVLRLVWGLVGSRYARFGSFAHGPSELGRYVAGTFTGKAKRYIGHNPGSAVAALLMFVLLLGLGYTGAFMATGGEAYEEVHEVLAWTMLAVVGVHLAGIVWHTIRHRENIAASMVTGEKQGEPAEAIPTAHAGVAVAFLALTGLWAGGLYDGYDATTRQVTLPLLGTTLQLGEGEEHEASGAGEGGEHEDGDDDDARRDRTSAPGAPAGAAPATEHDDDDDDDDD